MKLLTHGINRVAMVIFNVLIVCSLIGAVALIPGDIASASGLGLVITILAGIIGWILVSMERRSPGLIIDWTKRHKYALWSFGGLIGVCTVAWQIMLVRSTSGHFGWDPTAIMQAAVLPESQWHVDKWYFSYSPNNFLLAEFYHYFAVLFGLHSFHQVTIGANYLNIVVIDIAALFLFGAIKRMGETKVARLLTIGLCWALTMIFPYIVIPYSDTWAILIGSMLIFSYVHLTWRSQHTLGQYLWIFIIGVVSTVGYFIKPSTVIFAMAIVLVHLITGVRAKQLKKMWPLLVGCLIGAVVVSIPVKYAQSHTKLVRVDPQKRYPSSHFLAMGMVGDGSFNYSQATTNNEIQDYKERDRYNWYLVRKEATNYVHHPDAYIRFIFAKQIANTSEGTFGWAREGHFLEHPYNRKNLNLVEQWQQRHFFNQEGVATTDLAGLNILAQLVWVITLGSLLIKGIELDPRDRTVQILKYTILGGMLFLLTFEGGRSRYMMQFLPYVIMVSAINITGWYNHRLRKTNNQEGVS